VVECFYEEDPRYVLAVVRPSLGAGWTPPVEAGLHVGPGAPSGADTSVRADTGPAFAEALRKVETICEHLEALAVAHCFNGPVAEIDGRLAALAASAQIGEFLDTLEDFLDLP
jgi:hypothetical protein